MIAVRLLEFHAAHACNLHCAQCSHYSNFHVGGIVSLDEARENFNAWRGRLNPRRFAILGGEPTLNPQLCEILALGRYAFRRSKRMLVSNGFYLHRHPDLPRVLIDHAYTLEISQHGESPAYLEQFQRGLDVLAQWQRDYPALKVRIRQSHHAWRRQYDVKDNKALPMLSNPRDGWNACIQKHCCQLYLTKLWKCPALAYFSKLERKLQLEEIPDWQLFRDYQACPPTATDAEIRQFLAAEEIPQCGLCPDHKIPFKHTDPTVSGVA